MNTQITQNTPKIVANSKNNNNKPKFFKKEVKFKSKEQLQAYLADAVVGNKRKSFNLQVQIGK